MATLSFTVSYASRFASTRTFSMVSASSHTRTLAPSHAHSEFSSVSIPRKCVQ